MVVWHPCSNRHFQLFYLFKVRSLTITAFTLSAWLHPNFKFRTCVCIFDDHTLCCEILINQSILSYSYYHISSRAFATDEMHSFKDMGQLIESHTGHLSTTIFHTMTWHDTHCGSVPPYHQNGGYIQLRDGARRENGEQWTNERTLCMICKNIFVSWFFGGVYRVHEFDLSGDDHPSLVGVSPLPTSTTTKIYQIYRGYPSVHRPPFSALSHHIYHQFDVSLHR